MYDRSTLCPYCNFDIAAPKKRKCPKCGMTIRTFFNPEKRHASYVKPDSLQSLQNIADEFNHTQYLNSLVTKYKDVFVKGLSVTEESFADYLNRWFAVNEFTETSVKTFISTSFNALNFDYITTISHEEIELVPSDFMEDAKLGLKKKYTLYIEHFNFLRIYRDTIQVELLRDAFYYKLLYDKLTSCHPQQALVRIMSKNCCRDCCQYDGMFYFEDVISKMPIPSINCPSPWKSIYSIYPLKLFLLKHKVDDIRLLTK